MAHEGEADCGREAYLILIEHDPLVFWRCLNGGRWSKSRTSEGPWTIVNLQDVPASIRMRIQFFLSLPDLAGPPN
jgi:hypothetical protein